MKTLEAIRIEDWDGGDRTNFICHVADTVPSDQLKKRWPNGTFIKTVITVFDSIEEVEQNTSLNMLERPTK